MMHDIRILILRHLDLHEVRLIHMLTHHCEPGQPQDNLLKKCFWLESCGRRGRIEAGWALGRLQHSRGAFLSSRLLFR